MCAAIRLRTIRQTCQLDSGVRISTSECARCGSCPLAHCVYLLSISKSRFLNIFCKNHFSAHFERLALHLALQEICWLGNACA